MIQLFKAAEPQILTDNQADWTQTLLDHEAAGTTPTDTEKGRYNHADIKTALKAETHGKCAYCESFFEHVTYGDIEHIVAKKNGAKYAFAWSNLTIACDQCNTKKGTKDHIIDPYLSDPEIMFRPSGPMLLPRPEFADAVITEREIELRAVAGQAGSYASYPAAAR